MVTSSTTDDTQLKDSFIPSHLAIDPALGGQGEAFLNGCCHLDRWCTLRKKSELQEPPGNASCFFELGSVDLSTVRNVSPPALDLCGGLALLLCRQLCSSEMVAIARPGNPSDSCVQTCRGHLCTCQGVQGDVQDLAVLRGSMESVCCFFCNID